RPDGDTDLSRHIFADQHLTEEQRQALMRIYLSFRHENEDLAGRLRDLENRVSAERRGLHERIDTLQAELVERHKSGNATLDGLLT
ncbi:MAG TPA: hypothetical protein VF320_02835, partial [Acidimicrobiales bacterium]